LPHDKLDHLLGERPAHDESQRNGRHGEHAAQHVLEIEEGRQPPAPLSSSPQADGRREAERRHQRRKSHYRPGKE
jgi:hypothetical protein